jgi:hypothetical protein
MRQFCLPNHVSHLTKNYTSDYNDDAVQPPNGLNGELCESTPHQTMCPANIIELYVPEKLISGPPPNTDPDVQNARQPYLRDTMTLSTQTPLSNSCYN